MKWVRERRSNTEPEKREGWLANTARTPGEVDGAGHGERIPLSRRALSLFILTRSWRFRPVCSILIPGK
jgi:hypothetical protein